MGKDPKNDLFHSSNSNITADHFYSVSTEKPIEIFNLKAGFWGIYGAVVVLQGTRSSATSNRKMDQSLQCTVRYDM